jgi:hypothetical protein
MNTNTRRGSAMDVLRRTVQTIALVALALALASCSRKITRVEQVAQQPATCFECHSDTTTFLVAASAQWAHSKHGEAETLFESSASCSGCHTGDGFVQRANGLATTDIDNPTPIHCFSCHAPHTNGDFRLRWNAVATVQTGATLDMHAGNICAACHQARRNINTYIKAAPTRTLLTTRFGPHHGPQTDMLIGTNGYQYTWYAYDLTPHRAATTSDDKDGCLECHMKTTNGIEVGGHSFNMRYEGSETLLNTKACEPCHGTVEDFDINGAQTEIQGMIEDLEARLVTAGLISDGLPRDSVKTSADSAGAVWNLLLVKDDRSLGVHNYEYIHGLLESSIQFISGARGAPRTHAGVARH